MTALRGRMTQDLILRGSSLNTQAAYLRALAQLARYYRRSPERISEREVADYLLHLYREKGRSHSTCNQAVAALRFLYHVTLRTGPPRFGNRIHRDDAAGALAHLASLAISGRALASLYLGADDEPSDEAVVLRWIASQLGVAEPLVRDG